MATASANADSISRETSPAVALFQKAHGRIIALQRLDEQVVALVEQRRKIQDELRTIQALINEEFERVMKVAGDLPSRMLSQIAEAAGKGENGHSGGHTSRVEVGEVVS